MILRNENGKLDAYAWPGGYPILYYFADGGACCPACANNENGSEAYCELTDGEGRDFHDNQWHLIDCDIYDEGPEIECSHCGALIESAYGDPDGDTHMTIYRERSNGRFEYWTYCDRVRVSVSPSWAMRELARGAKLVSIK